MKLIELIPEFVEFMPPQLKAGILYVSITYATASHRCCCGCGEKVVTPLSPTDWKLIFDGESVSLHPSIGNWSLPCRSHYLILQNRVQWAGQWSQEEIEAGRLADRRVKSSYFNTKQVDSRVASPSPAPQVKPIAEQQGVWSTLKNMWSRIWS